LKVVGVEFVRSAAGVADLPRDPLPQVALVGRSNVGKSTLINAMARRKVARTSAAPGKTRLLNLYLVRLQGRPLERLYLVDLPGYGFARGGSASHEAFEALAGGYFAQPAPGEAPRGAPAGPTAVLLLVDARHPGLDADLAALDWLCGQGRPVLAVATKVDKLSRAERARAMRGWQAALNIPILPVSAVTGEGLEDLWKTISTLLSHPK
jgi:GTP-binding protein